MPPIPDCAHNHFTAPLPQRSPFAISQRLERQVLFFFALQDIDRVRFLWFTAFSIPFLFFQMISTNWYRKAVKSRRIRGNQIVLTGTLQHPFWGDVSLLADAKRRTD